MLLLVGGERGERGERERERGGVGAEEKVL